MKTENLDLALQYAKDNAQRDGQPYIIRSGDDGLTVVRFPCCGGMNGNNVTHIVMKDGMVFKKMV